jgi:uncharacterized protein HemY
MPLYARINKNELNNIKQANHVSPQMHKEVDKFITDPTQTHSQVIKASDAHLLARRLLQDLPIVPTSERIFELAQEIEIGLFDDLGPIEEAFNNWDAWKQRVKELLKAQKILVAANKNEENVDYYDKAEKFITSIDNLSETQAYDKLCNKVYEHIFKNKEFAIALIEAGLEHKIFSKIDSDELLRTLGIDPDII